tara:strand:- start:967 stop:1473 length:507 start_codon:yes stop_codon:yes gene_type:complete
MLEEELSLEVLRSIPQGTGMLWDKIAEFKSKLASIEGTMQHSAGTEQSDEMKEVFPLTHHLSNGLYTRQLFMPKGSFIISMIHKQNHPSFLLSGKVSYLNDQGLVETITAPHVIHTQEGAQRVLFIHEDTKWCCVYKTDAKTFEEAEADVYADSYKELPQEVIKKRKL